MSEQTETLPVASFRRGWKSSLSLGIAVLACPCHLPLMIGLLAGTALGAWISQHSVVVMLIMLGVFVTALRYGLRGLNNQPLADDVSKSACNAITSGKREPTRVSGMERDGYST